MDNTRTELELHCLRTGSGNTRGRFFNSNCIS